MAEDHQCSVAGCEESATASLRGQALCRHHFVASCCRELDDYLFRLKEKRLGEVSPDLAWRFVHECIRQADRIEESAKDLDQAGRAQLLDIILRATEVGRHLRRSPRKAASIPLRLHSEKPAAPWEEDTETRIISRYGALVTCQHPVEINQRLRVVRLDNGREAHARVAWYEHKRRTQPEIGIEFTDCDNFWEIAWDLA